MARQKVVSVTKADCVWQTYRGSGAGGQNRNVRDTAVRCTHPPSGAVGTAQDERNQGQNRKLAFKRMAESKEFQTWAHRLASGVQALESQIQAEVERQMHPRNLKIEIVEDGEWVSDNRTDDTGR